MNKLFLSVILILLAVFYYLGTYKMGFNLFGKTLWQLETDKKEVVISIDDGPSEETKEILNVLDEFNIKATFFLVGKQVEKHPQFVKEILSAGHQVGNHSYSHSQMQFMSLKKQREEILQTGELIKELIGVKTFLFRPPYLRRNIFTFMAAKQLDYKVIGYSFNLYDWEMPGADIIVQRILKQVKPGSIIGLHDGKPASQTAEVLRKIIPELQNRGYTFSLL